MKKFSITALIVMLVAAFAGTAMADRSATITDTTPGMRVSKGPVVIQDINGTGTTLYVATGYLQYNNLKEGTAPGAGVSVYAIDTQRTNTDGTLQKRQLTGAAASAMQAYANGVTLISAPVVTTKALQGVSVFYTILAPNAQVVGSVGSGFTQVNTGVTIISLNGSSGAMNWQRGIALNGLVAAAAANAPYADVSPLTLDDESIATSGATLYMAAGVDTTSGTGTGATVYSIDADNGAIVGEYAFPGVGAARFASTVSGFFSAPFISGASLYVLGWDATSAGVTLYGMNRNNLYAGVSAVGLVNQANMDYSHAQTPTPAVSGNSIYVVAAGTGTQAGVTVYNKYTLAKEYYVPYGPVAAGTGVSASPVTDGNYIVLSTLTAVSAYPLTSTNGLSANRAQWTIDLAKLFTDGIYQIWGTPAISNGYVYIPVSDTTGANRGFVLRCTLGTATANPTKISTITEMVVADPIISAGYVYAATYNPTVHQIDGGVGAVGFNNWQQFKFDKAKTGYNYNPPQNPPPPDDDDSGCFITTVK
jgi:hypothetical protein